MPALGTLGRLKPAKEIAAPLASAVPSPASHASKKALTSAPSTPPSWLKSAAQPAAFTVSSAVLDVALPQALVTTQSYNPASAADVGLMFSVAEVAPEMAPPLLRLSPLCRQR